MLKYVKYIVAIFAVAVFAGCATRDSARVAASVDQDFVNVYDAFEMAKNPTAKVASGDTVSMSEGVWLGDKGNTPSNVGTVPGCEGVLAWVI